MKRIITLFLVAVMLCGAAFAVSAADGPPPAMKTISYTPYINGWRSYNIEVAYGEEITLEVRDLTLDGEPVDASDLTFSWYAGTQSEQNRIPNENGSSITLISKKTVTYTVAISAEGAYGTSGNFWIKTDTITNKLTCTNPIDQENSDDNFFAIEDCKIGQDITFTLNSTSLLGNPVTYSWKKLDEYREYVGEELSNTTTLKVNKDVKGFVEYGCAVSDGNFTDHIVIRMFPIDTLTETIKLGGVTPERFERGYMIVANPGDKVDLTVAVKTTNPNFTRRWERVDMTVMGPQATDFGTAETITVIKRDIPDDDYDFEMFECYLDDGNEVFNVGVVLFSLHPYQVTQETDIKKGTPTVTLDDETEKLANSLLQKDMEKLLDEEKKATITLSAEEIDTLKSAEQKAVAAVLPENTEIGTSIDINLYKEIEGDTKTQITETAGEIALSVEVPKALLDNNSQAKFIITRIHDGKAENLDCTYDADTKKVSFKTDKFSTYVLSVEGGAAKKNTGKSPATGDSTFAISMFVASLSLAVIAFKKCTMHN